MAEEDVTTTPLDVEAMVAQGGGLISGPTRDVVPPIHMSTTFERAGDLGYPGGAVYARDDNPSFEPAEQMLCALEGGPAALLFSSGMAAAVAVFHTLPTGARIVAPAVMYWGLRLWLTGFARQRGMRLDFYRPVVGDQAVDETGAADLAALLERPTDLLWLETPANPTWDIVDIARAAGLAHAAGARVVVDSTVSTPIHTKPLALGADLVMHSATKALNGHSDVIAGALVCRRTDAWWDAIAAQRAQGGAILGPLEAWLLARGMRTLFLRVRAASAAALIVARHFEQHPRIDRVLYPGLASHPGHEIARRQMHDGFGAMLSLRVAGGRQAAIDGAARLRLVKRATSLGSTESLVEHRASIEGADSLCPDDLLRLSVGIEPVSMIIADLEQALAG